MCTMKTWKIMAIVLGTVFVSMSSCSLTDLGQSRISRPDMELALVDLNGTDSSLLSEAVTGTRSRAVVPGDNTIYLRATVDSPQSGDGTILQASHVALSPNGRYAFVTYMLQGEAAYGALDVFDLLDPANPLLVSASVYPDVDLAVVQYDGSYVYIGGQKNDQTGAGNSAWIRAIKFSGTELQLNTSPIERSLPGYFVTGIANLGSNVYVSTGTNNASGTLAVGLYRLNAGNLEELGADTTSLDDLRSVAVNGSDSVAAFNAPVGSENAFLRVWTTTLSSPRIFDLPGIVVLDQSKTGMQLVDNAWAIAVNRSGVVLVDQSSGLVQATIPAPSLPVVAAELQSSNSISTGFANSKGLYMISNGEAGLWVGDADNITDSSMNYGLAGSIRFGAGESVNHADSKNTVIVAATGLGGVRIMEITKR